MFKIKVCSICGYETEYDTVSFSNGDLVCCPKCGIEYEYVDGEFVEYIQDGEDWGE